MIDSIRLLGCCLAVILASTPAKAAAPVRFVIVAGDHEFSRLAGADGAAHLVDQARRTYDLAIEAARADGDRAYVIFLDPRGSGRKASRRAQVVPPGAAVRFVIFDRGRQVYTAGTRLTEVDATAPSTWKTIFATAENRLGRARLEGSPRELFYYGEQFGSRDAATVDLNPGRGGSFQAGRLSAADLAFNLEPARRWGQWTRLVFQTCGLNTLQAMQKLLPLARGIVVPVGKVANEAMPMRLAFEGTLQTLPGAKAWIELAGPDAAELAALTDGNEAAVARDLAPLVRANDHVALDEVAPGWTVTVETAELAIPLAAYLDIRLRAETDATRLAMLESRFEQWLERYSGLHYVLRTR